jgi:hypothetical protein
MSTIGPLSCCSIPGQGHSYGACWTGDTRELGTLVVAVSGFSCPTTHDVTGRPDYCRILTLSAAEPPLSAARNAD